MSCDADWVQRTVGLSFEGFDVTVEVDYEVVPYTFAEVVEGIFQEEWFYF